MTRREPVREGEPGDRAGRPEKRPKILAAFTELQIPVGGQELIAAHTARGGS